MLVKMVVSGLALTVFGWAATSAQQEAGRANRSNVITNWVGYLVAGRMDTADRMTSFPAPTTIRGIEIGLRSDGTVVWRDATKAK